MRYVKVSVAYASVQRTDCSTFRVSKGIFPTRVTQPTALSISSVLQNFECFEQFLDSVLVRAAVGEFD